MELEALLKGDFDPETFFTDILPEIHDYRGADDYDEFCEIPLVISFLINGDAGEQERWTVRFQLGDLDIARGELDEEPLFTLVSDQRDWPLLRDKLPLWMERVEHRMDDTDRLPIEAHHIDMFRTAEGVVQFSLTECPVDGEVRDIDVTLWLNDYKKSSNRAFRLTLSFEDYRSMVEGDLKPARAFADGQLRLEGDVALAMQLSTMIARLRT